MSARITNVGGKLMGPVPIKAKHYQDEIAWGSLGDVKAAIAKQEMARMLQLYDYFKAWLQPVRQVEDGRDKGKTVWQVCFPAERRQFKSGPAMPNAIDAMLQNYIRNKAFKGYNPLERGNGFALLDVEKLNQASHKEADKNEEEMWRNLKSLIS